MQLLLTPSSKNKPSTQSVYLNGATLLEEPGTCSDLLSPRGNCQTKSSHQALRSYPKAGHTIAQGSGGTEGGDIAADTIWNSL